MAAQDAELALVAATARIPDAALADAVPYLAIAEVHAPDVPAERRKAFELELSVVKLALARRRGDLPNVLEAKAAVDAALREQPPGRLPLSNDLRATALMDLGIAETWAAPSDDARRHLEEALALVRRLERPYLEVAVLGHLALAHVLGGERLQAALELSEAAAAVADTHGLTDDPVVATACAVAAAVLVLQGHFDEGESYLDRGERTVRSDAEPATELIIHHTRGQLRLAQGRPEEALTAFRSAERAQAGLVATHAFEPRLGAALAQARMGDTAAARTMLAALPAPDRDAADARAAAGAIALAEGALDAAAELVAAVGASSTGTRWGVLEALLVAAVAQPASATTGVPRPHWSRRSTPPSPTASSCRSSRPEARDLLERHPRYRSAHGTLLSAILDTLAGKVATARRRPLELDDPLSDAELRVMRFLPTNLKMNEIASELFVSSNTVRTHVSHIYRKLGAHSRSEAVARGRELGLLAPSSPALMHPRRRAADAARSPRPPRAR